MKTVFTYGGHNPWNRKAQALIEMRDWVISDPISGKKVRTVCANFKGLVIASRGFKISAARDAARHTLNFLIEKIGAEKFNAVIAAGRVSK